MKVTLFLPPLYPKSYAKLIREPSFAILDKNIKDFIIENSLKSIGNYDPSSSECDAEEFRDEVHATPTCIKRIFQKDLMSVDR
jgi:hypothetical protein